MLAARLSIIFARASRSTLTITKRGCNLAVILEMRRAEEAIDACRQCMALQPSNSEAYAAWQPSARCAEQRRGCGRLLRSLRLKPAQPDVLARLGELLLKSGDAFEALHIAAGRSKSIQHHEAAQTLDAASWRQPGRWIRLRRCSRRSRKVRRNWRRTLMQLGSFLARRAAA